MHAQLLHPRHAIYVTEDRRANIRQDVQKIIDLLGSPEVSIDDHHSPRLCSRFLASLLEASRSYQRLPITAKAVSPPKQCAELRDNDVKYNHLAHTSALDRVRESMTPGPVEPPQTAKTTIRSPLNQELFMGAGSADSFQPPLAIEDDDLLLSN